MTKPPAHIDPDTLVTPLMNVTGPLPEGTPLYDSKGDLIATLGESVPSDDPECDWSLPLIGVKSKP